MADGGVVLADITVTEQQPAGRPASGEAQGYVPINYYELYGTTDEQAVPSKLRTVSQPRFFVGMTRPKTRDVCPVRASDMCPAATWFYSLRRLGCIKCISARSVGLSSQPRS